ncbi:uncharacterized protein NPIL_620611 [Nephila pilipes]|uniref:Uncharacterized protein n=1 Tax=Nephila pilipes TaxID=299642 RepID=A0A8X6T053_NEPPI|nr:uncharacterized protein NPIL_620611 [Nephila pilipes]
MDYVLNVKPSSYEFSLFCESEDCNKDGRLPRWLKFNLTQPKSHGEPEEIQLLFVPELPTADHLSLFFVIKSVSGIDQLSEPSNRAEVILSLSIPTTTTNNPIITDDRNNDKSATIGAIVGGIIVGLLLLLCIGVLFYFYIYKPRRVPPKNNKVKSPVPDRPDSGTEVSGSFRATSFRDRGSMRRVESFPVLLYTHDQIKDFKKKVDPPLYRPAIVPKPWMSMNVLSNSGSNKDSDCKSLSSSSTVPVTDKSKSSDIKQLDDISQTSEASQPGEAVKF